MYLVVFTCMPDESCRRRFGSLLLCSCDVLQALVNSLCLLVVKSYDWFKWAWQYFFPIWVLSAMKRVLQIRSSSNQRSLDQIVQRARFYRRAMFFRSDRPASKVLQASNILQIRSSSEQGSTGEQCSSDQIVQRARFYR